MTRDQKHKRNPPALLSFEQTNRWATWAHLTALFNLFTLIGGLVMAFALYLWLLRRSPLAAFHALQALLMQLALWVGGVLLTLGLLILAGRLSAASAFGIFLYPLGFLTALIPIGSVVYGAYGAWLTHAGVEFKYYRAGDLALRIIQAQQARL